VAHSLAGALYMGGLRKALGSRNVFTASTLDQMPKHVSCGHLFGSAFAIPVPDVDRTDFLLILGADPWSSNGSLWTAPDLPGRLKALRARGGRFVVVDPRRSRTAQAADRHLPIRPGTDVFLLLGLVHAVYADDLVDLGRLAGHVNGVAELRQLTSAFTPETVAARCGVDASAIRQLAHELSAARRAAVYGRIGTTTVEFGTVTSWLVDVLNILTGNLDRPGGAMFPLPAHSHRGSGRGKGFTTGRWRSRVRGLPEVAAELPAVTLVDEIETPGEGQVRALITVGGNPALSVPNSERLDRALATLDFVVCVDPYLNETTRHAEVILPTPPPSQQPHYDMAFYHFSVRNIAKYVRGVVPLDANMRGEDEILLRLTTILAGLGPNADLDGLAEIELGRALTRLTEDAASPVHGADVAALRAALAGETASERLLEVRLRSGPHGDWFGRASEGLSLRRLLDHPHGVDLGPLTERIPEILRTPSGRIELCPPPIIADLERVRAALAAADPAAGQLVIVGRRHLRSNNSWLHNVPTLVKGRQLCTLQVHPADAARLGLVDGGHARVTSRVGRVTATVEVTDDIARGVVSLPHGWGHDRPGVRLSVATQHPGVNTNVLSDDLRLDPLSGTAVLNGGHVEVAPVTDQRPNYSRPGTPD
jgi:anaerobic selenocysteine-containing dehydrogenase